MSSMATPSHAVLSFDHEVTQWMSRVILVRGSALNSDQLHALTGRGPNLSVKVQSAGSIRGVGPAVSTGKFSTRCCPGGIRPDGSDPDWRPVKPRVTIADFLRAGAWNQSSGAVASGPHPGPRGRTATNAAPPGPSRPHDSAIFAPGLAALHFHLDARAPARGHRLAAVGRRENRLLD